MITRSDNNQEIVLKIVEPETDRDILNKALINLNMDESIKAAIVDDILKRKNNDTYYLSNTSIRTIARNINIEENTINTLKKLFNKEEIKEIKEKEAKCDFLSALYDEVIVPLEAKIATIHKTKESLANIDTEENIMRIANEMKKIEDNYNERVTEGVTLFQNVTVVDSSDPEIFKELLDVETIDIGKSLDDLADEEFMNIDEYISFVDNDVRLNCIYCDSKDVLIVSSTEGYCNGCHKSFVIERTSNETKIGGAISE